MEDAGHSGPNISLLVRRLSECLSGTVTSDAEMGAAAPADVPE